MKNRITIRLPPNNDSFSLHVRSENYQARAWNSYAIPEDPQAPSAHGWKLENAIVVSILPTAAVIPDNLVCLHERASYDSGSESEDENVSGSDAERIASDEFQNDFEL